MSQRTAWTWTSWKSHPGGRGGGTPRLRGVGGKQNGGFGGVTEDGLPDLDKLSGEATLVVVTEVHRGGGQCVELGGGNTPRLGEGGEFM